MGFDSTITGVIITAKDDTLAAWASVRAEANKTQAELQAFGNNVMAPFKAVQGAIAAISSAFAGFEILNFTNKIAESAAALQRMHEVTGASVESLSALRTAAKLSDSDFGSVEAALIKMDSAMSGVGKNAKTFEAALDYLGISARDSNGQLKSADAVYLEIAKSFEHFADGAGKTALAVAIFGKAGAQQIPIMKELGLIGEYVAKVTTQQAEAAKQYEQDLVRLTAAKTELVKKIAIDVIPAMDDVVKIFLRTQKEANGLRSTVDGLVKDGSIKTWADSVAMWVAHVVDTFVSGLLEIQVAFSQVKVSMLSFQEFASRMPTAGLANPLSDKFAEELTKEAAYLAQLKSNAALAANYRQTLLGGQQSDRASGHSIDNFGGTGPGQTDLPAIANFKMPDAKTGVDLIAQALKYYGDVLGQISGQEKQYTEGMEKLLLLYNARLITTRQLTAAEKYLYDTRTLAGQEISKLSLENAKIQEQIDLMKRVGVTFTGTNEAVANYTITYGKLKGLYQAEKDQITDLARKLDLRTSEEAALKRVAEAHQKLVDEMIKEFDQERIVGEQITKNNDAEYARAFAVNEALRNEINMMGMTGVEREKAMAQIQREIELEHARMETDATVRDALIDSINKVYDARNKLFDLKDAKTQLAEMSKSLTDALVSAFESGKGGVKTFITWIKDQFAKLILQPLIKPVADAFSGTFTGLVGGIGTLPTAGAGGTPGSGIIGGIASAFQSLLGGGSSGYGMNDRSLGVDTPTMQGLFDKYLGSNSSMVTVMGGIAIGLGVGTALGSSGIGGGGDTHHDGALVGTAVGAIVGTIVDLYWGGSGYVGGSTGAAAGGAVGGIFDSFNPGDAMRTASVGMGPGDYTYGSTGSKFGDIGIQRGTDQHFSDSEMGTTLRAWFQSINKLDAEVAHHFSADEITRASAALAGQAPIRLDFGMEHTGVDPAVLSEMLKKRYSIIFTAIDQQMADLIANFKGSDTDLAALIVDLSSVHEKLSGLHAQFTSIFGQDVGFADIAKLKGDTENYSDALARLANEFSSTNQIAEMLGKTQEQVWGSIGLASEGARAHLIALAGGLQNLSTQLDFYYSHFYTTQQQQAHTLATLQQAFSDVGVAMPTTIDGFRAITDRFLSMGEAGAQAAASMLGLASSFYTYIQAVEAVDTALAKNQLGFRSIFGQSSGISVDDVRGFQQNGEVLTATLTRLTGEFNATNSLLVMFGASSQEVFGAFGLASEAARARLIELSGGLQTFTTNLQSFYQNYFSQTERNHLALADLGKTFADLGLVMPSTLAGFRALLLQELSLGPAGAAAVAALLGVQQQFYDLFKDRPGVNQSPVGKTGGLQVTTGDFSALGDAAMKAHAALVQLNQTLMQSFTDAYRSIQLAGLDNQHQYEYLQKEAASLTQNLRTAGTSDDVKNFSAKITQDMTAAFGLLSTDEQNSHRDEFLTNLLRVSQMVTDRLTALDPTGNLNGPIVEPAIAAANAQTNAATAQKEAATMNKAAAADMQEAAKAMLVAQQIIKRIQVQIDPLGLVVEAGA